MFGREAAKILDYVECFPNGAGKGRKMAKECSAVGIEGFPTWVIKDKVCSLFFPPKILAYEIHLFLCLTLIKNNVIVVDHQNPSSCICSYL